mgnify:CR=1 FL=1
MISVGLGIDAHPLVESKPLILGGVDVSFDKGLDGHSDGDVLIHAVIDSILGGSIGGDIGTMFPSTDSRWKDISSLTLLKQAFDKVKREGWMLSNLDATIVAERPLLQPFIHRMIDNLDRILCPTSKRINIKATTMDKMGFVGRGEGISALAIALLVKAI